MPKAYWISHYQSISDPTRFAEYAALASTAIGAAGGRLVARGNAVRTFEGVEGQRDVVVEFDSVDAAVAAYESDAYQAALRTLQGAVVRDVRIVEGAS